ncbi:gamma-glutamyl-gamma-aminobutyrate hydrolase family protein [Maribellus sediminis]|uniref:gamma-glutamyl-gamma-aminobutyrate hydrolase family protein n=1 Tax=Maribellus sediminis TaxID=2696285 RepID=UPI00143124D5|nr:gamma-glutamyl-gamma-aminobutyrate hydrolase family protein [Maribellus sediminis]
MKKLLTTLFLFVFVLTAFSQNFFDTDFDHSKRYIILCDPTVARIKTIQYLTGNDIFEVKKNKVKFVGVYFEDQNYDFSETKAYIEENKLKNFFLQEIKGDLSEDELFRNNEISAQLKKVFDNSIGVIFFGGPDIPPSVYGEENTRSVVTDPERHYFEASFLFHLLGGSQNENFIPYLSERPDYVVTGFCLGMQTMNVATGGTLVQDIPEEIYGAGTAEETVNIGRENLHRNYWQEIADDEQLMGINLHTIQFTNHPFFGEAVKVKKRDTPRVYSSHHQAAEKIGKDLAVTALSPDGKVVEALAHNKFKNVFAVQFHPEVPALYEEMQPRIFHPDDVPKSYYDIIGKSSVRFHKEYWAYISKVMSEVKKK